jgi:hypothetical protein
MSIREILCWLNIHKWKYYDLQMKRKCVACGHKQTYVVDSFASEDGWLDEYN